MYGPGNAAYPPPPRRRVWLRLAIALIVVAIVGFLLLLYLAGFFGPSPLSNFPYPGYFGGYFLALFVLMIVFFMVRVAFMVARPSGRSGGYGRAGGAPWGPDPAIMAARERYARGEITREQFDQIMSDLDRRGRGPGGPLQGA